MQRYTKTAVVLTVLITLWPGVSHGEQLKIGVSTPLTGNAATYGSDVKNALVFANEQLGAQKYELVIEDDKCSGKEAASVAQKLINIDKVRYVVGIGCSGAMLAAAPIYERSKTIAIGTITSSPEITNAGDYIFRTWPSDVQAAKLLFDYVSQKHKKVGVLSEETDYAQAAAQAFIDQNTKGHLLIHHETFIPGTSDLRSVLLRLKTKGVEGLLLLPQAENGMLLSLRQTRQMNWNVPVYGNFLPSSPTFLAAAEDLAEGIVFSDAPPLEAVASKEGRKLYNQYVKQFGKPKSGDIYFITTYAAFQALHQAIRSGGDVKDYLYQQSFSNVVETYRFDKNGDIVGINYILKRIENGKPVLASIEG